MNIALIFAGGVGKRMKLSEKIPKQFLKINNIPIIIHTILKFENHANIDSILVVCKKEWVNFLIDLLKEYNITKVIDVIPGGETGMLSIRYGLQRIREKIPLETNPIVLIHDGVRPIITEKLISDNINCVLKNGNSISVSDCIETVGTVSNQTKLKKVIDRDLCLMLKAPQSFYLDQILKLHNLAEKDNLNDVIDSATLCQLYNIPLFYVNCPVENIKVTTIKDLYLCDLLMNNSE